MTYLRGAHALLGSVTIAPQPSAAARGAIGSGTNEVMVSAASGWEISVKYQLGKLELAQPPERLILHHVALNGFGVLPVTLAHGLHVHQLLLHHRDPFDRMLIAQSAVEKLPIVTRDPAFSAYGVEVLW